MDSNKHNGIQFNERSPEDSEDGPSFLKNIIIVPSTSSWYSTWKYFYNMLIFAGYLWDPLYIAFVIGTDD